LEISTLEDFRMTDANLLYCQHMVHLCATQADEWRKIRDFLASQVKSENVLQAKYESGEPSRVINQPRIVNPVPVAEVGAPRAEQRQTPNAVQPEDPARARLRMRLAHVFRGVILIFALGLPRMFYYLYGVYGVFVLSGALDKLQSAEFRRFMTGSRPSLDLQLARLRQRIEMLDKLEEIERLIERDEPFDSEELRRVNEFLSSFEPSPNTSWIFRFNYQLFFMFFYSMLPGCHPNPELLK
jgi:hypothetical protein